VSLVSVVIPCYNDARFLPRALKSVFTQTHREWEILLVDDGSTDDTPRIAAACGDRIRYFRRENRGAGAARNLGIGEARGEFVAFLDADDIWYPPKLELQLELFSRRPELGLVYTDCHSIDETGAVTGFYLKRRPSPRRDPAEELFIRDYMPNSTIVCRRSCFDKIGLIDTSIRLGEDEELKIRLADRFPVGHLGRPLAAWRQHPGNKSLMVARIRETFEHDTDIICRKFPRLVRWRALRTAVMHENCGFFLLRDGRSGEARREFLRALAASPARLRSGGLLLLSLIGGSGFLAAVRWKKRLQVGRAELPPPRGEAS